MTSGAGFGGRAPRGAGGTPGGLGEFFVGVIATGIGVYLFLSHVQVSTSFWHFRSGPSAMGPLLLLLVVGIGVLFFNGRSVLGWLLTVGGLAAIVVGVVMNLDVYFRPTSLLHTLLMLGSIAAGLGLIIKALRPHGSSRGARDD